MRNVVNSATIEQFAALLQHYDESDEVWLPLAPILSESVYTANPIDRWTTVIANALTKHPAVVAAVRQYLLAAIDDDPVCAGVELRVGGVDFVVAGGTSYGDEPYEGYTAHKVLELFLLLIGEGVPEDAAPPALS